MNDQVFMPRTRRWAAGTDLPSAEKKHERVISEVNIMPIYSPTKEHAEFHAGIFRVIPCDQLRSPPPAGRRAGTVSFRKPPMKKTTKPTNWGTTEPDAPLGIDDGGQSKEPAIITTPTAKAP